MGLNDDSMLPRFARWSMMLRLFCSTLLCLGVPLAAQSTPNRITGPIDETHVVPLRGNVSPFAQARFDRGPAPLSMPTGRIALILGRSAAQQQALTQFLADVQNPTSGEFHHWLTPAQYGERFGPSDSDLESVESWLQSHGFEIDGVAEARNFIEFSGSIEQVQNAFHTSIHTFSMGGETHYANTADPEIPAALAPVVAGITPLSDFHPRPNFQSGVRAHYDATSGRIQPDLTLFGQNNTPYLFVDPADAATIYDTPNPALNPKYSGSTWDGTGVNIGILGVSDLTLSDVQNYRSAFLGATVATGNLPTVIVDGDDPGLVAGGAADEALLDNEIAGALAPGAKLYYYTSADSDLASGLMNAYFRALDDNTVSILNISFSGCEAQQGAGGNQVLLEAAEQAAAQGISVVVSSGDGGSAGCDNFDTATVAEDGLGVNGIASTPYTIAVGGTDFDVLSSAFSTYVNAGTDGTAPYYGTALGYIPEEPWNESTTANGALANNVPYEGSSNQTNIVAGGGGVSSCVTQSSGGACLGGYAKPAFQTSLTPSDKVRDIPDVSLFASAGFHGAYWLFCSDSASDGNTSESYTECIANDGQLAGASFGGAGGTSASAPAFAGMLALVAQSQGGARLGQADTVLYQLAQAKPSVFHDVTTGNNSVPCASGSPNCGANGFLTGYNAGAGYDLASGLGSVDVAALVNNWSSVSLTSTATSLTINGSKASYSGTHGANLTFNTSVTANAGAPTGNVAIVDTADQTAGGTANGPQNNGQFTISLKNGSGTGTWNGLPGGTYTVAAQYGGDTANAASTSNPISVTIAPEPSTTTLALNALNPLTGAMLTNLSSIPYGSQVTLDSEITGNAEGAKTQGLATGGVSFMDGSTLLATASVDSENTASWPALSSGFYVFDVGAHSVAAQYSGDASFEPSNSSATAFTIVKDNVSLSATANPGTVSDSTTTSVTVTLTTPWNLGVPPSGAVTLSANGSTLGTLYTLTPSIEGSGAAKVYALSGFLTITDAHLVSGNNAVTVSYGGDPEYNSATTTVTINSTGGTGNLTLTNGGGVSLIAGQSANASVTATPTNGFNSPVMFTCTVTGPVACGVENIAIVSGTTATTIPVNFSTDFSTPPGSYQATVTGVDASGTIKASTTIPMTVTAVPANAAIALSNSGPISTWQGSTNSYTALITVTPSNGYIGQLNITCSVTSAGNLPNPPDCQGGTAIVSGANAVIYYEYIFLELNTLAGSYTVNVTATDQLNPSITASTSFAFNVLAVSGNPSFALANSGNITVTPGASGSSTISLTPSGGFTGTVTLACSLTSTPPSAIDLPTCSVPYSVDVNGADPVTGTLNVLTTEPTSSALVPPRFFLAGGGAVFALVLFVGIPARRRGWRTLFGFLAVIVVGFAIGCGGGGGSSPTPEQPTGPTNPGTTAGAYTITVTATDLQTGKITASTQVGVTVN